MWIQPQQHFFARRRALSVYADNAGFSLFELLVAIALIALTFLTLFGIQADNVGRAEEARFQALASRLAQQKLVEYNLQDFTSLADESGNFGPEYPGLHWQSRVHAPSDEAIGLAGGSSWLKQVELSIQSTDAGRYEYTVRSLLVRNMEAAR